MVDRPAAGNLERASVQYMIARVLRGGLASAAPEPYDPDALQSLCPTKIVERQINHLAAEVTVRWAGSSRSATADPGGARHWNGTGCAGSSTLWHARPSASGPKSCWRPFLQLLGRRMQGWRWHQCWTRPYRPGESERAKHLD